MTALPENSPRGASLQAMASHLFISKTRVRQLQGDGIFPPGIGLDDARRFYLEFLRDAAAKRGDQGAEARRWQEARAKRAELALAVEERQLVPADEAQALNSVIVTLLLSGLDGLPARITSDLVIRRRAEAEIDALRGRVADQLARLEAEFSEGE